jgi:hypothetical protein
MGGRERERGSRKVRDKEKREKVNGDRCDDAHL